MTKPPFKLHIVGDPGNYGNWLTNFLPVSSIEEADLVMFTGGVDINPAIYGKKAHHRTQAPNNTRDSIEISAFDCALAAGKPMVGICRGAQLLCALNGGILVQDMKHPTYHSITTDDGLRLRVTSDHHQRAHPYVEGCEHKLLAWAEGQDGKGLSYYSDGEDMGEKMAGPEAEIVYYPRTKSLGIQSHPEWQMPASGEDDQMTLAYLRSIVRKLMDGKL